MRLGGLLLGLLLFASVVAVVPAVRAGTPGFLYLTPADNGPATASCSVTGMAPEPNELPESHYKMATAAPIATGKAYLSDSTAADSCYTYFDFTVTQAFSIPGDVTAHAFFGCDAPTAAPASSGALPSTSVALLLNGALVGKQIDNDQAAIVCTGGSAYTDVADVFPAVALDLKAGDVLTYRIIYWGPTPGPDSTHPNAYIATGVAASMSLLTADGIPGAASKVGTEAINLAVANSGASTAPGGSAMYDLTITNVGAATNYTLMVVDLSSTYTASFNPLSARLATNTTGHAALKVDVPESAAPDTHLTFKVKVVGTQGANKTVDLSLDVKEATTTSGPPTTGPSGGTTGSDGGFTNPSASGSTSKKSPGVEFLANILAVSLVVVAMRRRIQ